MNEEEFTELLDATKEFPEEDQYEWYQMVYAEYDPEPPLGNQFFDSLGRVYGAK